MSKKNPAKAETPQGSYLLAPPDPDVAMHFIREFLGETLWDKQQDIVRAVFTDAGTVAVASCTGAGKTRVAAAIALAWVCTGCLRTAVTTAPTGRQVRELLWKELRKLYRQAAANGHPIGGTLPPRAPELRFEEDWAVLGFSSSDEVNMQGFHTPGGTLFILDEAMGVKEGHWDAIKGTLTGGYDRLLAIGNPTTPAGRFYELFKPRRKGSPVKIQRIHISAFDSPNYKAAAAVEAEGGIAGPECEVIPGIVTKKYVDERREEWGEDSPLWKARVLGEFPDQADNVLIPIAWIDAAIERWKDATAAGTVPTVGDKEAGLDVARFGDDKSVLGTVLWSPRMTWVYELTKRTKADTMAIAGMVAVAIRDLGLVRCRVDADGVGAGVYDRLAELGLPAIEMRGGMRASDTTRFVNARSEWHWQFREALRPDAPIPLALPDDAALLFQATTIRYRLDSSGRIEVESKETWRRRTEKSSPDELDAVAYTLAKGAGSPGGVEVTWV